MSQQFHTLSQRFALRRLSGYLSVLAIFLLTLVMPGTMAQAQTACSVTYATTPQSSSAFGATLAIKNIGTNAWTSWTVSWNYANGQTISSGWNGIFTQSGSTVTVTSESYNGSVAAGGSVTSVGFNGTWNGTTNAIPTLFSVNGTTCEGTIVASFTIAPSPATLSVAQGGTATSTITVTDTGSFTGASTFTASGLPTGVSASFSPTSSATSTVVTFTASSTATVTTTPATVTITATSGSIVKTATIALSVTAASSTKAVLSSPTPGSTLTGSSATFSWNAVSGATAYKLTLGSTAGASDIYNSYTTAAILKAVSGIPTSGATLYATLWTEIGTTWSSNAYTYKEFGTLTPTKAVLTTPTPSSTLTGSSATFGWTAGTGVSAYKLILGTTAGGSDVYNSYTTSAISKGVSGIPTTGGTLYATLYSEIGTIWSSNAYTYTEYTSGTGSFTIAANPTSLSIAQGASATDTITVTDTGGFTGTVTCAASGLPTGVTASWSNFILTLNVGTSAPAGTNSITVTCTSGSISKTITIPLTITIPVTANATITVDTTTLGAVVSNQLLGMNLATWYDNITNSSTIVSSFESAGIKSVRWPGGGWSDLYHWSNNTNCFSSTNGAPISNETFSNFVSEIVTPAGLDVSLTADYGTNAACTGGGDPSEAAAWASEALTLGANVSHITVGNEVYGSWEEDMHSAKNDPTTYANAVAGSSGYYESIKAVSPKVQVGVVVQPDYTWDSTVLANAKYDFVEFHYYPEAPGGESDTTLIQKDAQGLTKYINTIKSELATAGHSGTPIFVGEVGGPYTNPGKQSWSITQGLYAGEVLGEMMNAGVTRLSWWIGYGNCNGQAGNDSASLYGWQNFGAYNVFSDGPDDPTCPTNSSAPNWGAAGTMSPTARAFELFSQVAVQGEYALTATVSGDTTDVRAYSATSGTGTALVLFNLNETTSEPIQVVLSGKTSSSAVTVTTYDKAAYDQTENSVWADPTTTNLGAQSLPLTLTLTPWSMNVVIIK